MTVHNATLCWYRVDRGKRCELLLNISTARQIATTTATADASNTYHVFS